MYDLASCATRLHAALCRLFALTCTVEAEKAYLAAARRLELRIQDPPEWKFRNHVEAMMVTWASLAGSDDLIIKDLVVRIFRLDPTQAFSGGRSPDDPYDISSSAHHIQHFVLSLRKYSG